MSEHIKQVDEAFLDSLLEGVIPEQPIEQKVEDKKEESTSPVTEFKSLESIPSVSEDELESLIETEDVVTTKENTTQASTDTNVHKALYEAQIEFFKTNGTLPEDFELEEGVELDEETFGEVLQYSKEYLQEQLALSVREQYTSQLGNEVVEFLENGGNYQTFAELIKEQNKIQDYNLESIEGQKAIVKKYYTDVLNYPEDKANARIDKLINYGDLEDEVVEVKAQFDKYYADAQKELVVKQQEFKKQQEELLNKQITNFQSSLQEQGLSQKDIDSYVDFVYKDAYKLKDGSTLPAMDVKILQIQKNPKELAELVMFLSNKEEYLKKKAVEINNPKVDKTFKTIVKSKTKGESIQQPVSKPVNKFTLTFNK